MSNPSVVILQLVAAVANGIALSQQPAAAGALTLNGSLVTAGVAQMDVARRVVIASNGNDAAVVFTVNGTNQSGAPIISTVTGLNASSAFTALDFLTVTSVTSSTATAGNITVGTNTTASSPWVLDNLFVASWNLNVAVSLPGGNGTATYTVEHTQDDPNDTGATLTAVPQQFSMEARSYVPPLAWPNPVLVNMNSNGEYQFIGHPIFAHRLTITAGTGEVVMQSIQSGID